MSDKPEARESRSMLDRTGYELEVEDRFDGSVLNEQLWIPFYLPQWSSRSSFGRPLCSCRWNAASVD